MIGRTSRYRYSQWIARNSLLDAIIRGFFSLDELRRCFPTTGATGEGALQRVLKGLAEVAVEVRVNKRVQGAVEVTYPE